jgi:hypothetical protein
MLKLISFSLLDYYINSLHLQFNCQINLKQFIFLLFEWHKKKRKKILIFFLLAIENYLFMARYRSKRFKGAKLLYYYLANCKSN